MNKSNAHVFRAFIKASSFEQAHRIMELEAKEIIQQQQRLKLLKLELINYTLDEKIDDVQGVYQFSVVCRIV